MTGSPATYNVVITRLVLNCALGRVIQYSAALAIEPRSRCVLDAPLEPVIGLAEGETRWRGMTVVD